MKARRPLGAQHRRLLYAPSQGHLGFDEQFIEFCTNRLPASQPPQDKIRLPCSADCQPLPWCAGGGGAGADAGAGGAANPFAGISFGAAAPAAGNPFAGIPLTGFGTGK